MSTEKSAFSDPPLFASDSHSNIRDLKKRRGTVKGRLTLFVKHVTSCVGQKLTDKQLLELKLRQKSAMALFDEFNSIQDSLELITPESELASHLETRELFETTYYDAMADADFIFQNYEIGSEKGKETSDESPCDSNSLIKLPTITLPSFDGSYDNWLEFRDTFLSMIHNSKKLDDIQKYHYLRSALTGNALQVIKSLEFSADSYIIAWELLNKRYNNMKLLVHNHVKALFSLQSLTKESPSHIKKLIDSVLKNLRALKTLGEPTDSWDTLIIHLIVTKLDPVTEKEWEQYKINTSQSNFCLLQDLLDFLKNRADMLEMIKANNSTVPKQQDVNKKPQRSHCHVSTKNNNSRRTRICSMCSGNHSLYACSKFLELSAKDKLNYVEGKNLCKNCLRVGHVANDCFFGPCRQCNIKHNSLLHSECSKDSASTSVQGQSSPDQTATNTSTTLHVSTPEVQVPINEVASSVDYHELEPVLLATAIVEVLGSDNKYYRARTLLDNGSQHCFITKSFCQKINASSLQSTRQIVGVASSLVQSDQTCRVHIKSIIGDYRNQITCMILNEITRPMPAERIDLSALSIPNNIQLADPLFYKTSGIDLLIGNNHFEELFLKGKIRLPTGTYLRKTVFGWVVTGPILTCTNKRTQPVHCNFVQSYALDEQVKRFWEIEELHNSSPCLTPEERACEELFVSTHKRTENGRFSVRIPLKESADTLGDSYDIARNRFLSLERKLDRTPQNKQMYSDFMQEYLTLGHMTRIENYTSPYYFLPHHGVFRESSLTTKLRVVFSGSDKTPTGKSLNDIQMAGPPLQNDSLSILLRFRQYKYVACSDIEKFFRQILIQEDQRNLQLILWRERSTEPICVYQLNTVTYGTASAPFLSIRCVRQLGLECEDEQVSQAILNDFYVDDFITGEDCKQKLADLCRKVTNVCNSGCFPLRKWVFNSPDIAPDVVRENSQTEYLSLGENCSSKTLGLGWQNNRDDLHFTSKINKKDSSDVTKREILSIVSQIYDPMGLLSPVIIIAKILLQKLWLCKVDWDDSLPHDIIRKWNSFLESLSNLHNIRIPRCVIGQSPIQIELHIFTDASEVAYGACAYVRTICSDNDVVVNLLCSKTRVAPLKPVSIPRLELCAAIIGARLMDKITKSLRLTFNKIVFWTDSTIVLGWLRMSPHLLKTFVQNRVVEINELAGNAIFLHVSGKNNPADILSRGLRLDELSECDLWWHGPLFLRNYDFIPKTEFNFDESKLPELKSKPDQQICLVTNSLQSENSQNDIVFDLNRFSSFKRLQRVYAYVMRFIHNARSNKKVTDRFTGCLSVNELNNSLICLTRVVQKLSFPTEYDCLLNKLPLKSSRNLSSLNVFMDENNIIRVGGRLANASNFTFDKKHPMLLCGKHYFTQLLFQQEHLNLLHAGPQLLLAHIRDRWWPLGGRNLAKKTTRQCVKCTRMAGKTLQPIMGNLPSQRLKPEYPFLYCGVDYAGPMFMLNKKGRGSRLEKCYLCLFICFSTRALHLELVTSLTSESYILALKRFISRRGKPKQIFSDHGRNFVGAARELTEFLKNNSEPILNFASDNSIEFKFIPPYAPHFGGLWEAGVKSCKYHISRVIGNSNLTYEEFSTVLVQIEAVLNSRPMYPMSSDPDDLSPLTPAHFLLGRPLTAPPCADVTTTAIHSLSRYQRVEQMRQNFWKRWSKEYVSELQRRVKWKFSQADLQPNTMVLIKDDNLPPLKWRLGRILSVFPGQDGVSRVASIRTASGVVKRAFSKLCPLPVSTEDTGVKNEDQAASGSSMGAAGLKS